MTVVGLMENTNTQLRCITMILIAAGAIFTISKRSSQVIDRHQVPSSNLTDPSSDSCMRLTTADIFRG